MRTEINGQSKERETYTNMTIKTETINTDKTLSITRFLECPSFGILETRKKHNVSETGSVSVLR
jgi:hypothetical protein